MKRGNFVWRYNWGMVTKLIGRDVQLTKIYKKFQLGTFGLLLRLCTFGLLMVVIYTSNDT